MSSAAFPQPQGTSPFGQLVSAIPVPDRNTHIPAWYVRNPHRNPGETVVTSSGIPLLGVDKKSFVVAQVAEERRWAILEDGELMDQVQFAAKLGDVRFEYIEMLKQQGRNASFVGDMNLEYVPSVSKYVSVCADPEDNTRLGDIGYDPHAGEGRKPEQFVNSEGDSIGEARIDTLTDSYHNRKLKKLLSPSEIAEVEAHLGVSGDDGDDGIAGKLEMLKQMKTEGTLTDKQYVKQVASLTGSAAKPKAPKETLLSRCGKECRGLAGKTTHERNCGKCKDMIAPAGDSTEGS